MSLAQNPQAMAELDLGTAPGPDGQPASRTDRRPASAAAAAGSFGACVGNGKSVAGIVILILFLLIAVFAPVISPGDPNLITGMGSQPPSPEHWLGTTAKGQDVLALNIWGSRSSLFVGFSVGILATARRPRWSAWPRPISDARVDNLLSLVTNVFLLLPGLPLLVILAAFLPQGLGTVILVLVITGWAGSARVLRSQAMSIRGKDFVGASTGHRRKRPPHHVPGDAAEHGVDRHEHLPRLRHLRHRRAGRASSSWASATPAPSAGERTSTGRATTARC